MILVDTSIWIELQRPGQTLQLPERVQVRLATCGPVIQEVLQGESLARSVRSFRRALLALPRFGDPLPLELFLRAAELYQWGRARGLTIRSSADCLIAAIALAHELPVWHQDRDFDAIARFTPLRVLSGLRSAW